jgi:hypothetical protein|tara:strand:+ start:309 stop:485 length:177 start_codon:yes stop_codon:yes gene_type:complete
MMEEKARRLRGFPRYDNETHLYQLPISKELFKSFKARCVEEEVTVREKLISLVESSLS